MLSIVVFMFFVFVLTSHYQNHSYNRYTIQSVIIKTVATIGLVVMFYQTTSFH